MAPGKFAAHNPTQEFKVPLDHPVLSVTSRVKPDH
jgi:hypothetical protein